MSVKGRADRGYVRGPDGCPLLVFRGEHGEPGNTLVQTRQGSITFGDRQTASMYAASPNDRRDTPTASRVLPAYLRITRPFVNDPDDPYVDAGILRYVLSTDEFEYVLNAHEAGLYYTNAWEELGIVRGYTSVHDLWHNDVEGFDQLPFLVFRILDDPIIVEMLRGKGYDGAVYAGYGYNFERAEYRVFSEDQILPHWTFTERKPC